MKIIRYIFTLFAITTTCYALDKVAVCAEKIICEKGYFDDDACVYPINPKIIHYPDHIDYNEFNCRLEKSCKNVLDLPKHSVSNDSEFYTRMYKIYLEKFNKSYDPLEYRSHYSDFMTNMIRIRKFNSKKDRSLTYTWNANTDQTPVYDIITNYTPMPIIICSIEELLQYLDSAYTPHEYRARPTENCVTLPGHDFQWE